MTDWLALVGKVGDWLGQVTSFVITWLGSLGVQVTPMVAKAIWIFISVIIILFGIKVMEKPIKWFLIILAAFIIISIGVSFIK